MVALHGITGLGHFAGCRPGKPHALAGLSAPVRYGSGGLPALKARDMVDFLVENNFRPREGKKHTIFQHPDGRTTTVPRHKRSLCGGTLQSILQQANLKSAFVTKYRSKSE